MEWIGATLNRKFLVGTAAGLLTISLVFLVLFLGMYRNQLAQERSKASLEVNRLLQASLENAMLKRDLEGLRNIITHLGAEAGINSVMILNPSDEVRFSSDPTMLKRRLSSADYRACEDCPAIAAEEGPWTVFVVNHKGREVLRSVNPVRNKPPCTLCHGSLEENPINGVLLVDYDASPIRRNAQSTTLMLMGSGAAVVLVTLLGGWWFMSRFVLRPVDELAEASHALSSGELDRRVDIPGTDELAQLGHAFNTMANSVQGSLRKVREKEAFLQALVDAVPDGIRAIDDQFNVVVANQAYRDQLAIGRGETTHTSCYASSHGRSEPCPPTLVTCPLHEIKRGGKPLKTLHRHVRADGTELEVEVYAAPMQIIEDGRSRTLVVESIRDLAKQIQFSHEQKLAEMGRLATGVAHEIHNPLASIRLALQATLRSVEKDRVDVDEICNYLELVDTEIDRCIDVTERLLKLAQTPDSHPELVLVNPAVSETVSLLVPEAQERGIVIEQITDISEPRVMASDSELRMLVLNLVQNGFHAMPQGGQLTIHTRRNKGWLELAFEDTGVGISPEDRPHVFEPFFSRRADGVHGTGLGLAICKAIVTRYGGQIGVEGRPAAGSRFTVMLPDADSNTRKQA